MAVRAEPVRRRALAPVVSLVGATQASLRRLREDAAVVWAVLGVVALASFLFAAVPRALNETADDGLRYAVAEAGPLQSDLEVRGAMRVEAGPPEDPFRVIAARGEAFAPELGSLREVLGGRSIVVDSPRYEIGGRPVPGTSRFVTLHQATDAEEHVNVVEGRLPELVEATERVRVRGRLQEASVLEVALSQTAAGLLTVGVGDRLVMTSDAEDPLVRGFALEERTPLVLRVAGLFEPRDPESAFWRAQPTLDAPLVEETPDRSFRWVYSLGLFAPEAYGTLFEGTRPLPLQLTWRYELDPARFDAAKLPRLEQDVRRLDARYGQQVRPTDTYVRTGLPAVFEGYRAESNLSRTLLALVGIGLLVVALAVIGMLASLIAARRSGTIALARARGASAGQMLTAQAAEGLLLAVPVGLAAYVLALVLVDGRSTPLSALSAAIVVGAAVALLVALSTGPARRTVPLEKREEQVLRGVSPRRLALEGLVVLVSLVGVYLLRRRGLGSEEAEAGGVDLYLAAVPVLLGVAVGLVALRLYPLPLGALSRVAAGRRDLVPVLGARRVARQPGAASVAVLILVLAVGVAVFAAVEVRSIERGHEQIAWERVGADVRVDAEEAALPQAALDAARREGDAVAEAWVSEEARVPTESGTLGGLTLLALDLPAYRAVVEGTPAETTLPPAEGSPAGAVISTRSPQGAPLRAGEPFTVVVGGRELELTAAARADRLAGLPAETAFAVVPLDAARRALGGRLVRANRLYVRGGEEAAAAVAQAAPRAQVLSRAEVYDRVDDSPLAAGTVNGFRGAAVVAAVFAAVAVVLAVVLTSRARARDLSTLQALGLSPRQALGLTALEIVPPALLAILIGIALGIGIAHLIAPGVDLSAFTGAATMTDITVPTVPILLLAAGLVLVLALTVAAAGRSARRADLGRTLRAEER
jgi:putative ABC transport system permease protein